jgi:hypothetical protein
LDDGDLAVKRLEAKMVFFGIAFLVATVATAWYFT